MHERPAAKALPLDMDDSNQFRLAGRLLATIERFASDLEEEAAAGMIESETELDEDATPRPEKQVKQPKKVTIDLDGEYIYPSGIDKKATKSPSSVEMRSTNCCKT